MKTRITDLVTDCCPENVALGKPDEALALRITDRVQRRLGMDAAPRRRHSKLPRAFLLAAALVLAFGTAAFALAGYGMSLRNPTAEDILVSGFRYEEVVDGKVWNSEILAYPDAGMVFTFACPEESSRTAEFRCFWLPREATEGTTDAEGWTKRLFCDGGDRIPYSITTFDSLRDGFQLVLSGDVSVVKEERWGGWKVLEVTSDCSKLVFPTYDRANFILLFDETAGFLVVISGEEALETLEHIAREMEIRESATAKGEHPDAAMIGLLDLARG